jgi:hypothetical protein
LGVAGFAGAWLPGGFFIFKRERFFTQQMGAAPVY